jgi:hypothetical protein
MGDICGRRLLDDVESAFFELTEDRCPPRAGRTREDIPLHHEPPEFFGPLV